VYGVLSGRDRCGGGIATVSIKQSNITPQAALILAVILAIFSLVLSANYAIQYPWIGVELGVESGQVVVKEVHPKGSSATVLYEGDRVLMIGGFDAPLLALKPMDVMEDPNELPTYEVYNEFRQRQAKLTNILSQPTIQLLLEDGRTVRVQPAKSRPLLSLPWDFWLNNFFAMLALLISTGVWSVQKKMLATRLLLISGLGYFFAAVCCSVYISRELALPAESFHWLSEANSIGTRVFAIGGLGLLWFYPRALATPVLFKALVLLEIVYMVNEVFQWHQPPLHAFVFDLPFLGVLAILLGLWRWKESKYEPLDRAIVKWFLITVLPCVLLVLVIFVMPMFFGGQSLLPVSGSYLLLLIMYGGLALGVLRYRLFDIDRWWKEIWLWFFAGLVIALFDILLVAIAGMAPGYALGLSVLIAAWFYFPVRQWLWGRFFYRTRYALEEYVPMLVGHFVQVERGDLTEVWMKVLENVFHPISIQPDNHGVTGVKLLDNGIHLVVPCLQEGCCMRLQYAEKGRRLFNNQDVRLAQALFDISRASAEQRESYLNGMQDERRRIMRDLHDDVGGRLLTLTHSAKDGLATIAAEALKSLREIIYSLDTDKRPTLNEAIAKWRIEALERCEAKRVAFNWKWNEAEEDITLSARQVLNLTLILREALSNAFKHSDTASVEYCFQVIDGDLNVTLRNGAVTLPGKVIGAGKGLQNMKFRTEELGGAFKYKLEDDQFDIVIRVPLIEDSYYA